MTDPFFSEFVHIIHTWRWPLLLALCLAFMLQWLRIPSRQRLFTLLMSLYFFLVVFSYWILKPIKKGIFIGHYKAHGGLHNLEPSQMELLAKEANVLIALLTALSLIWLRRRFPQPGYPVVAALLFALGLLALVPFASQPGEDFAWAFYLYGDAYVTAMVALFFATLHDRCSVADSRSVYGLAGLGGVLGGFAGSAAAGSLDQTIGVPGAIATCAAMTFGVAALAWLAKRYPVVCSTDGGKDEEDAHRPQSLLGGARAAFHSPSLRLITGMLLIYEIASVVMDYQFTTAVSREVPVSELKNYFGSVYTFTNALALLVQLFLATWMLKRFGAHAALLVMPFVILLGEAAYLVFPVLLAASLLNTADGAFAYSIQQTARESLYVPLPRRQKYEAKAFIDIVWLRFAKGLAVLVSLAISLLIPGGGEAMLAAAVMLLALMWLALLRITVPSARFVWFARAGSSTP